MKLDSFQPQRNDTLYLAVDVGVIGVNCAEAHQLVRILPYACGDKVVDTFNLLGHCRHGLHQKPAYTRLFTLFKQGRKRAVALRLQAVKSADSLNCALGNLVGKNMCVCVNNQLKDLIS